MTTSILAPPQPSWRVLEPNDAASCMAVKINKQHLDLAGLCTPHGDTIVDDYTSRLSVQLGLPQYKVLDYCDIGITLRDFPRLAIYLGQGHFHIDLLRCLAKDLFAVKEEHRADIEAELIAELQPRMPNEAVPSRRRLHNLLQRIIEKHQPSARPRDDDFEPSKYKQLSIDESHDEFTDFHLTLPKLEGLELKKILDHVCITEKVARIEALMLLVRAQTTANITLNIYRRVDEPDSRAWAAGQWLSPIVTAEWLRRVTHVAAPGFASTAGYHPTPLIRASVEGRDGTCRFPGCEVPAHDCQLDHVRRWEEGASGVEKNLTSTANLHCLCQQHHNLKTSGQWDVTLHADGTETWTSHGDGHTVSTRPNGVLGQHTFDHRAVQRTRTLEEHNDQRAAERNAEKIAAHAARDNEPMCREWGDIPF